MANPKRRTRKSKKVRTSVPVHMVGLVEGRSIFTPECEIDRGHPAIIRMADAIQDRITEANGTDREEV